MSTKTPDPLEQLLDAMQRSGLDISVGGLMDAFWLAVQPGLTLSAGPKSSSRPARSDRQAEGKSGAGEHPGDESGPEPMRPKPQPAPQPPRPVGDAKGGVYAAGVQPGGPDTLPASPLRVPAASALAGKLALSRSLRPLRKWYRNQSALQLDETATVEETARAGGAMIPVMQPGFERWYELFVVSDSGASMDVWHETLAEFEQMARAAGVFRDIRRYRLIWGAAGPDASALLENADGVAIQAITLAQTNVRRLVLLATNGSGQWWTDGRMAALTGVWSRQCSIAIVQMLPSHMWGRTRTGDPKTLLRTLSPGTVTMSLDAESPWVSRGSRGKGGPRKRIAGAIPVLPLDPAWMGKWARMQMGGGQRVPAVVVGKRPEAPGRPPVQERTPEEWERAVSAFTRNASPEARRLAVYLASGPFTLPVARLVQAAKFGAAASQTQLAELLLSGIVERSTPPGAEVRHEWVEYRIYPAAAEILRRGLLESDVRDIADALEKHIERHWGRPVDFRALVYDEQGRSAIPKWAQPFVQLAGGLLGLPTQPEPDDDGRPIVFVLWGSARNPHFEEMIENGLEARGFRVLVSGRNRVPRRGVMLFIAETEPGTDLPSDDYARTVEHGLAALFLLPPGSPATKSWMHRWEEDKDPAEESERLANALSGLSQEPASPVIGAPPLDRQHGMSKFARELSNLARQASVVAYSNDEFDGSATVRDIAWWRTIRSQYSAGVRWVRRGENYSDAPQGQLLIFERPAEPLRIPEGCSYVAIDPEFPAVAELNPGLVYEGSEDARRRVLATLAEKVYPIQGNSPHLAFLMLRLNQDRPVGLQLPELLGGPPMEAERRIREAFFREMPPDLRDVAGTCAALREDAPMNLISQVVDDQNVVKTLANLDLMDLAADGSFRASATARLLAKSDPSWRSWHRRVLNLSHVKTPTLNLTIYSDYFRDNLIYHALEAHDLYALADELSDFAWWALWLEHGGIGELIDTMSALSTDLKELKEIREFWLPSEVANAEAPPHFHRIVDIWNSDEDPKSKIRRIAQIVAAYDFPLPPRLRVTARAYVEKATRQEAPQPSVPPSYSALFATWEQYLDPSRDSSPLFDWRPQTPDLQPLIHLNLLESSKPADRIVGFTSFWLHPNDDFAEPVVKAAVPVIAASESMTELYIAVGVCNVTFLETAWFPTREGMQPLESAVEKLHLRLKIVESKRAHDVRDRLHKLDQQLETWNLTMLLQEAIDQRKSADEIRSYERGLGEAAPVYGRRELERHLRGSSPWRLHAYAVLLNKPDAEVTGDVVGCLVDRESSAPGFDLGLRALQSIVRGHPLEEEQWDRLQEIRPRLPQPLMALLESLNPHPNAGQAPQPQNAISPDVIARLEKFEGRIPYMYRSIGGLVAVGAGHVIASATNASQLPWVKGTRPATKEEIEHDYAAVAAAPTGMVAGSYETLSSCRMTDDGLNQLIVADLQHLISSLAASFPRWPGYPPPVQAALIDMAYNMGVGALQSFPKLLAAVDAGDWEMAARECHRAGISEARNQERANLFREAGGTQAQA